MSRIKAGMVASFFPWFLYIAAWGCTLFVVKHDGFFWPNLLYFVVLFNGGVQGIWAAVGHLCFPEKTAKKIGWQSNGFQVEIGFVNLAIGITGLFTFFFPFGALALGLVMAIFYGGCAYNHIKERIVLKNKSPCNSGPMLYSTIATSITLLVCLVVLWFKIGTAI